MPFKSEAQKRYLWANEPEIARDWTDTYGSKIHAADGGIMRLGLYQGGGPHGRGRQSSGMDFSGATNKGGTSGPAVATSGGQGGGQGGVHIGEGSNLHTTAPGTLSDPREKEDYFEQSWTGQPGIFGLGGGYKNLKTPGVTAGGHQSNFGIGNLLRGAMGMFGEWPGKIGSFASGMGDKFSQYGQTRDYWSNEARAARRNQKRIANMLSRRGLGKDYGEQNLYDLSGGQYDFRDDQFGENQAGITGVDAVEDFDITDLITKVGGNNAMDEYWKKAWGNNQYLGDNQYQQANWLTDLFKKDPEDIQLGQEGSPLDETKDILQKKKEEAEKTKERFKYI